MRVERRLFRRKKGKFLVCVFVGRESEIDVMLILSAGKEKTIHHLMMRL